MNISPSQKSDGDLSTPVAISDSSAASTNLTIFLLKTPSTSYSEDQSTVNDPYSTLLSERSYLTHFIPVLSHRIDPDNAQQLASLLANPIPLASYGGLVITSQRAVEALDHTLQEISAREKDNRTGIRNRWAESTKVVYVVGPATGDAVERLKVDRFPRWKVEGQGSGNGEALAAHILEHYDEGWGGSITTLVDQHTMSKPRGRRKPLLFLVGEQRRDIIPKTLMSLSLPDDERIEVEEMICYSTQERAQFEQDFAEVLKATESDDERWAVVFSPTGCEAMLRALGWLEPGAATEDERVRKRVRIACIGPTTKKFLLEKFGFEVDACASKPSPEGVKDAVENFAKSRGMTKNESRSSTSSTRKTG